MEPAVQEKFEYLESVLGQFIVQTNTCLYRLEKNISALSMELREQDRIFKAEIREHDKIFRAEIREMDEKFKKESLEMDEKFKAETRKMDEKFRKESWEMDEKFRKESREMDEKFKAETREMDEKFKKESLEMDEKFKKESLEMDEKFKAETREMDEKFRKEMDEFKNLVQADIAESRADRRAMNKKWGELANKMGTIVEDIVAPSLRGVAREYFKVEGFDNFYVRNRRKNPSGDGRREFDVVAYTQNYLFIVETKSTPRTAYIHDFIKFIPQISQWFPESAGKAIIPIFASLYLEPDTISFLSKNNILALGMKDENMDILNPDVCQYLLSPQSTGE